MCNFASVSERNFCLFHISTRLYNNIYKFKFLFKEFKRLKTGHKQLKINRFKNKSVSDMPKRCG